ncbi:MAG: leucine-rich repeat domain-containing protein [Clostridiales bacterium]|nr:leucine-rich repeat domain-containing protein [Clostridiales bacterium]
MIYTRTLTKTGFSLTLKMLLAALFIFTAFIIEAKGAEIIDSGSCGDSITWELNDKYVLTITGSGDMYDYNSRTIPWESYSTDIKSVVFSGEITSIGNYAFYYFQITELTVPETVTRIGEYAFGSCEKLVSVNIPDGVTVIEKNTFFRCKALSAITIPDVEERHWIQFN